MLSFVFSQIEVKCKQDKNERKRERERERETGKKPERKVIKAVIEQIRIRICFSLKLNLCIHTRKKKINMFK